MNKSIHILVSGRVQGVYFRVSARDRALKLGLLGMVRNLADGRVEILAQGSESAVERFLEWCWKVPGPARVDDLEIEEWTSCSNYDSFVIAD